MPAYTPKPHRTKLARGPASLELGFLSSPPPLSAPDLLKAFAAAQPQAFVSFREVPFPTAPVDDWLRRVDLAICHSPPRWTGLGETEIASEPRAVLLHRAHPLAACVALHVADVLGERFCGFDEWVDPDWAAFWTLDEYRGGPPDTLPGERPASAMELVARLAEGGSLAVMPSTVAATIAGLAPGLVTRVLADASPCCCSLVWREPPENPLAIELIRTARAGAARESR